MKKYILLISFFLLLSCDGSQRTGKDDYVFEKKEYEILDNTIEFVIIRDEKQFAELRKQFLNDDKSVQAFSRLRKAEKKCIIYIKDAEWAYEPEYIGHEVAHCIWGQWHNKRG